MPKASRFLETSLRCIICRHRLRWDKAQLIYVHRGNNRVWRYWPFDHIPMWRADRGWV